jgi:transposase-like protein
MWLEEQLAAGRSIESVAREVDRDPSTVSYWMKKHGLTSSHAERHAARGGIERDLFTAIVACGLPVRDMAEALDISATTVRYWLRQYGLTTGPAQRRAKVAEAAAKGEQYVELICDRHGPTRHNRRADGYRCARCESERVTAWRQRTKQRLVDELAALAWCAAMTGASPRSSSITSIQPRRASRSATEDWRDRSGELAKRRRSASCSALTAMPRSRPGSLSYPWRPMTLQRSLIRCSAGRTTRSGVAQWQSIRLLIEGLWVRVPPPELDEGRRPVGAVRRLRTSAGNLAATGATGGGHAVRGLRSHR